MNKKLEKGMLRTYYRMVVVSLMTVGVNAENADLKTLMVTYSPTQGIGVEEGVTRMQVYCHP